MTVVVACRNEVRHIRQLLACIEAQQRNGLTLDTIVADGMSTDGTAAVLDDYARSHPALRVIRNPRLIAATGLNLAVRLAAGEFIARMDAHTQYAADYLTNCVTVAQQTKAANVGGAARTRPRSFRERAIAAGFHSPFATGGGSFRQESYSGPVDTVPYGWWRRDLLFQMGLFDETLVRNQDDELNFRIRGAGGIIWQDASIVSYYQPRSTLLTLFRQYFQYGFWKVAVLRKHRRVTSARQLVPVSAFLSGVLLLLSLGLTKMLQLVLLSKVCALLLLALTSLYLLLSAVASLAAAKRYGWSLLPVLPLVFATYQLSYAAGFVAGLLFGSRSLHRQHT